MQKLLYIAGPYRAPTVNGIFHNIIEARKRMEWAWQNGWVPVCPHTNSAFSDGIVPDDIILEGYLHLLTKCEAILRMHGWQNSNGAMEESVLASNLGLKVLEDPFPPGGEL